MSIRGQFLLVIISVFIVSLSLTLFCFDYYVQESIRGKLIFVGGYLIAFIALVLLLNYTLLRRLERLARATKALTHGDYSTMLPACPAGSRNEIDLLAGDFLSMQQTIKQREQELEKEHSQAYSMFHNHQSVMLLVNPDDHTIVDANAAAEQFYGFTKRELLQKKISELNLLPADQVSAELRDCLLGMKSFMLLSNRLSSGEIRDVEVRSCPVEVDGQPCLFMIIHDVTEKKRAELKLQKEHQFFQTVIDGIIDPIFVLDMDYRIKVANKAGQTLTDWQVDQGDDLCCYQALRADRLSCADSCPVKHVLATGKPVTSIKHMEQIGKSYEIVASPYLNDDGNVIGVIECFRDITERLMVEKVLLENERKIHELSNYDPLTKLPNRKVLNDRLIQAVNWAKHQNRQVALLCLDLDRFKKINDTLGHNAGDNVLQEVARRLRDALRDGDTIARVGGDDFFIVLENVDGKDDICTRIDKLLVSLHKRIVVDKHTINITASVGVSLFPEHSDIRGHLMKFADIAMYSAKKMGGDSYEFYTDTMDELASEFLMMEVELNQAIVEQQLYLEYQPQFDLNDSSLVGMEALVRWRHPVKGVVPPGNFIPLAEETGLIQPLGEWVLREACRQISVWRQEGLSLVPVAVNVSSLQMQKADFFQVVDRALIDAQIPAECLELEITESAMMNRLDQSLATLQAIRKRGLNLAIDDFGTGYSSLSYLKRFPLSKLKIDRSFVRDLATDANDASITTAIIAMGQSLGLKVIAEGVENEEQREFLIEKGCDQVQGFLYSRSLRADQVKMSYLV